MEAFLQSIRNNPTEIAYWQMIIAAVQAVLTLLTVSVSIGVAWFAVYLANKNQQKLLNQQAESLRTLLKLEVERNFKDLKLFQDDYENQKDDSAKINWIIQHLPKWLFYSWQGQQTSFLLPIAVKPEEIRLLSLAYTELERLTLYKERIEKNVKELDLQAPKVIEMKETIEDIFNNFGKLTNSVSEFCELDTKELVPANKLLNTKRTRS